MSERPIRIRRKNNFNLLKEARKLESFDEFPMLRPEVDPQVHVSRNSVDQPFYLSSEKDMVLAQFSGSSRLIFQTGSVRYFDLGLGDFVYVPAGSAHRILVREPGVMIRYKAIAPGEEIISWHCDACGADVFRHVFDATAAPAQLGYQQGCEAFNTSDRLCPSCRTEHAQVDLTPFRWRRIAETLLSPDDDEEEVHAA